MKSPSIHFFNHVMPPSVLIWLYHHITDAKSLTLKEAMLMCQLWFIVPH